MAHLARRNIFVFSSVIKREFTMSNQRQCQQAMEEMTKNPYFEKYAQKIAALQHTSPEEFLKRVEKVAQKDTIKKQEPTRSYSELLRPKESSASTTAMPVEKKLSEVMKVELIQDKSAEEIKQIWYEYHKDKDVIAAVIPSNNYDSLICNGEKYPVFIFPLPRTEGYEFIMLQFSANTVHFTPLICYQVHKENAPECLKIVHYTDVKDKGIVLMRGEYDTQVLNSVEAQCLANQLQLYYCKNEESRISLLEKFTNNSNSFKHMDLIKELENIKLN